MFPAVLVGTLCCCAVAILAFPYWYGVRLRQWKKFSEGYPVLFDSLARPGSLERKFQSSKQQLLAGFISDPRIILFGPQVGISCDLAKW